MKKILFIEDEPALQKALTDTLIGTGFEVFQALDGENGLRLAEQKKPDIILLDLILPKIDGFEILRRLKSNDATKQIPVLVLTNLEGTGEVQKVTELGAAGYLVKTNYRLNELVDRIKSVLGV